MGNLFKTKKRVTKSPNQDSADSKKFSLPELVWLGFNYTCGIAFTAVFASMMFMSDGSGLFLGGHMIWIFLVEGLIAGTCAWAFNRLSQVHEPGNGASYIYVRTTFGKFWGWFVSFLQYTTLPIIVTSQIVSMVRLNFVGSGTILDTQNSLGVWSSLTWDSVGIVIYMAVSCTLFLGMRMLKKFLNISSYIKWGSTFLLVIILIVMFCLNGTSAWNDNLNSDHTKLTIESFSSAFTSCFFFFLGFETYATMGNNVKNPEKNIGKSIIWTMFLATIFYIVITVLFLGAIIGGFSNNPNIQIFNKLGEKVGGKWLEATGAIIMLICTMSLKINAAMQNALYSGSIIEPFATEGIFPDKFKELNEDGIPFKASLLNLIITFIFACIWLLIPDLIQGSIGSSDAVFTFSAITGEASLIMIIIYAFVIAVALTLGFTQKMKVRWYEYAIWIFAFLFLVFQLEEFFRDIVNTYIKASQDITASKNVTTIISSTLEIAYIVGVFLFAGLWYKFKYLPVYKKRMETDPSIQKELDSKFRLIAIDVVD